MSYAEQDLWFERTADEETSKAVRLYGVLRVPEGAAEAHPAPAVVCCHPFAVNHTICDPYAQALADAGFVTLAFDFYGGGFGIKSDGTLRDMTIMTERDDALAALHAIAELPFVDASSIQLLGCSQGGLVAAMAASGNPELVRSLMLMYPAFVLHDDALAAFTSEEDVPATYEVMPAPFDTTVSAAYNLVARRTDPYDFMGHYDNDVLIVHGTADDVVPLAYAERAQATYPHARLEVIEGGTHVFHGALLTRSVELAVSFAKEHA